MKVSLIIVAGGQGLRFFKGQKRKNRLNKLFLPLGTKPILRHTLESFQGIPQIREIVLAFPRGCESWVKSHVLKGIPRPPVRLVRGGATRAESVRNALLRTSPRHSWVMVHDGARPFPPKEAVLKLLRKPPQAEAVILGRPVVPTLKRVSARGRVLGTVERKDLFEAETPQLVRRDFLLKAYRKNSHALKATDESSLVESLGGRVRVLAHSGWNTKVTSPEDLRLAEAYCAVGAGLQPAPTIRIGFGRDTHRLVNRRRLYLGGIHIPFEKGALGHSDGDALLHALGDALLGAMGAGDIGDWFSDKDPRHKNIRSEKILTAILKALEEQGGRVYHVDTVIILERPRLGPYKNKIRKKIAKILGLKEPSVSIKAKTMEGLGPEGQGLAVTCEAIAEVGVPLSAAPLAGKRSLTSKRGQTPFEGSQ